MAYPEHKVYEFAVELTKATLEACKGSAVPINLSKEGGTLTGEFFEAVFNKLKEVNKTF